MSVLHLNHSSEEALWRTATPSTRHIQWSGVLLLSYLVSQQHLAQLTAAWLKASLGFYARVTITPYLRDCFWTSIVRPLAVNAGPSVSPKPSSTSPSVLSPDTLIQSHGFRCISRLMTFKSLSSTLSFSLEPQTPIINSFLLEYLLGYFHLSTHLSLDISNMLTFLGSASFTR